MSIEYFDIVELERWFKNKGDETHRMNYKLDENSIVLDVGGYDGEWSKKIYEKYKPNIHVYEPVRKFYNIICDKFNNIDKVKVYNFAISNFNGESLINNNDASSSLFIGGGSKESILIRDINCIIQDFKFSKIDLVKINIEGSEYDLLEFITIENIKKIDNIQVQFHKIGENYEFRRENIRKKLSQTHKITYDYNFVWENWEKINE
jgi:FkbM family methyltransferase